MKAPVGTSLKSVDIRNKYYEPNTDSYLILGKSKNQNSPAWLVGWQPRGHKKIVDVTPFRTRKQAQAKVDDLITDPFSRSDHSLLEQDWQQQKCYGWERKSIMPHSHPITPTQARALIKKVCHDYKVQPPRLIWSKPGAPTEYHEDEKIIAFRHRDKISLLHELAHHLHAEELHHAPRAHHSPAFIWWAIDLYSRYGGINRDYLIESAQDNQLIGDLTTPDIAFGHAQTLRDRFHDAVKTGLHIKRPERKTYNEKRKGPSLPPPV